MLTTHCIAKAVDGLALTGAELRHSGDRSALW